MKELDLYLKLEKCSFNVSEVEYVTIEDPPIAFSPFSLVDCTLISHFSFDDFVAVAFLDLIGDLDTLN